MSKLIIMMGCPGSGKSTIAKNYMDPALEKYVSRDDIRFSIVGEDEEYFAREKDVFREFVAAIESGLLEDKTVWADATHLNKKSRLKLLHALYTKPDEIEIFFVDTPLDVAIQRNMNRAGTRAFVPESAIERMYSSIEIPEFHEGEFTYDVIYIKRPEQKLIVKLEG